MAHTDIVQKLVDHYNEDVDFKSKFDESFSRARSTGLALFEDYKVHTVEDYFRYMDEYVHWVPYEDESSTNVYLHICLFYFIIDLDPISQEQDIIDPATKPPYKKWLTRWLIEYAQEMGSWMDTESSITPDVIKTFYAAEKYHMIDYPPSDWTTFNKFFAREIDSCLRPVAPDADDKIVIASPADCTYDGQWAIDEQADITTFTAKGVPWSISQLLADTEYGPSFAGGIFTHSFLSPTDYHRQHAPVSGKVIEAKVIPGICYLEVVLVTDENSTNGGTKLAMHRPLRSKRETAGIIDLAANTPSIDAPDTAGYQFIQARGLILIEADDKELGLVAVLPIGMAQVSSVILSVEAEQHVEKGQEISKFHLGGSDIVMVFQKKANVAIHQVLGQHYNYGSPVALARKNKNK